MWWCVGPQGAEVSLSPDNRNHRPATGEEDFMDDSSRESHLVSPELMAAVPETLAEAEALAASIEKAVQEETGGGVRELAVEVSDSGVKLRGLCDSFYCKQLAQHAAMTVPGGTQLINCIEVE
jgi:hypothetical protein